MPSPEEVLDILRRCTSWSRSAEISLGQLAAFSPPVAEAPAAGAGTRGGGEAAGQGLAAALRELARQGRCRLQVEGGKISSIVFPQYFVDLIRGAYRKLEQNPEIPFPTEESLQLNVPMELLRVIDIKTAFAQAIGSPAADPPAIIRLIFPEDLGSMVVTSDFLSRKLLEYSVHKMRLYLDTHRTASYMLHKMRAIFPHRELALKELFNNLMGKPGQAVQSILEPVDFTFRFWAHLSSFIIQEHRDKENKLPEEIGCSQAAYLVGFYTVYFKGLAQKEKNVQVALRRLDGDLRKPPYAFTIGDIFRFKDSKGVPLIQKYSQADLVQYLKEKTVPHQDQAIAEIVRLKVGDNREYFLHRDVLIPLCLKKVYETSRQLREQIVDEWAQEMRQYHRLEVMSEDKAFQADLERRVKGTEPLLYALLNYDLLFLTRKEANVRSELAEDIGRLLDLKRHRMAPLTAILSLKRKELLYQARLRLPVWMTIPIVRHLMAFLLKLFQGFHESRASMKPAAPAPAHAAAPGAPAPGTRSRSADGDGGGGAPDLPSARSGGPRTVDHSAAYRKAVMALREHFVGKSSTLESQLDELAEKWNPLFDEKAKRDLVEDVNSMIRDYVRSLKRGFRVKPPDVARIRNLAQTLADNRAFQQIRKKDILRQYIEVYLVKLLGER